MSFYERVCLPHLINCACGMRGIERLRAKVVPLAQGRVLEVGIGSGLNLKHYTSKRVDKVWGVEPSEGMRHKASANLAKSSISVEWIAASSEALPLGDDIADTVVLTYTLCTIPDWQRALQEIRRVLKPEGLLLFSEHGLSPDNSFRRWQNRLNPLWAKLAGGCNLNRNIPELLKAEGFKIQQLDQGYISGPRFATYQYYGVAQI